MKDFCVDLKVCEGCGALWLRTMGPGGGRAVYCRGCSLLLSEFPAVRQSRRGRKRRAVVTMVRTAVCVGGGR